MIMNKSRSMDRPGKSREIFLPFLSSAITEDDLRAFYSDVGEVESVTLIKRGKKNPYGFLRFASDDSVGRAMVGRPHTIKGKSVTPIRAALGDSPFRTVQVTRLFVGSLTKPEMRNEKKIRSAFAGFGDIEEIKFKEDDQRNQRDFCTITFADPDSCDKALLVPKHTIDGQALKVKKFLNTEERQNAAQRARDKTLRETRSGPGQQMGPGVGFGAPFPGMGGFGGFQGRGSAFGGMSYGYGAGYAANGYGNPRGQQAASYSTDTVGPRGSSGDPDLKNILLKAKVSPEAIGMLVQEKLLDTELLRSTTTEELAALGVSFGDRKRIQILMS